MISSRTKFEAAFTLVELIIGMSLSLMVMGAVLSSYVFLGRSFSRSLGVSSATEPNLEAQARRTLAHFAQDARMASQLVLTDTLPDFVPSENALTFNLSTTSTPKKITYYFNAAAEDFEILPDLIVPPHSIIRIDQQAIPRAVQLLHAGVLSCRFSYYDTSGGPYTVFDKEAATFISLYGIKQVLIEFTSQGGTEINKTLTPIYANSSPRLIMRNRQLLP